MGESNFKVGDIVKLRNGKAPLQITHKRSNYSGWLYDGVYLRSNYPVGDIFEHRLETYEEGEDEMANKDTLYEIKMGNGIICYGSKLAVNSAGEWVMELKGNGNVISVDKQYVEEVLPYTIDVQYQDNNTNYSFLAEKGQFEPGFYLVEGYGGSNWQIARVTRVDTKSRRATAKFKPIAKLTVDPVLTDDS